MEKHSVSRLSYLFAHLHLLSSDSFSSLIFSFLIFLFSDLLSSNLSLLSASSLLCFSSVHIVGSLTSKLPSFIYIIIYIYILPLGPFLRWDRPGSLASGRVQEAGFGHHWMPRQRGSDPFLGRCWRGCTLQKAVEIYGFP